VPDRGAIRLPGHGVVRSGGGAAGEAGAERPQGEAAYVVARWVWVVVAL